MVRDSRITDVATVTYGGYKISGPPKLQSGTNRVLRTFRGDLIKTLPNLNGSFFLPTPYSGLFAVCSAFPHDYSCRDRFLGEYISVGDTVVGDFHSSVTLHGLDINGLPALPTWLVSSAESRVLNAMRDSDWNLGQSLAEAPETIQFIISTVKRVLALYSAVKRGNLAKILAVLKSAYKTILSRKGRSKLGKALRRSSSSAWLEVQFAWRPLLNDVYQATKLLADGLKQPNAFVAKAESEDASLAPLSASRNLNSGVLRERFTNKRGVKVEVGYKVTNPLLYDLDRLGLTNPLSLAWELVPLSFVLDWFIPIGTFLDGIIQPFGLTWTYGYRTTYVKWSTEVEFWHRNLGAAFIRGRAPSFQSSLFSFQRSLYSNFIAPVPAFRGFGSLTAGGYGKIASLLALAAK